MSGADGCRMAFHSISSAPLLLQWMKEVYWCPNGADTSSGTGRNQRPIAPSSVELNEESSLFVAEHVVPQDLGIRIEHAGHRPRYPRVLTIAAMSPRPVAAFLDRSNRSHPHEIRAVSIRCFVRLGARNLCPAIVGKDRWLCPAERLCIDPVQ